MQNFFVSESSQIDSDVSIGRGTRIWDLAQIRENAKIGAECIIGRGVYIGSAVTIGDRCKIQNYSCIYEPAFIEEGVFIGPHVVLTNDNKPRALSATGEIKTSEDWEVVGVRILKGASIGASAVCVAPIQIGRYALIGAGAVVVGDVPDYALMLGVPARQQGWVCEEGHTLEQVSEHLFTCPVTNHMYMLDGATLRAKD